MSDVHTDPERLWSRLMDMAAVGATPAGGSNRQALSDDDRAGRDLFVGWAEQAGCSIELDGVGNLFARRDGTDPDALPVVLGSHLDTQPTGGRFDGVYGVLGGLEVVEALNDHSVRTRAPIEVAVWTNEEGSRFPVSMMGSAVWAGVLPLDQVRAITDRSGISVGEELDRLGWAGTAAFGRPLRAYLELHIEQGPILEASGSSIGVVTGVQGIRWFRVTIEGFPAHAGTTPMDRRRDPSRSLGLALSGLHDMAAAHAPQVRLTPAMFASEPVSSNTVPAHITFTVDMRHPDAATLESLDAELRSLIAQAAEAHGCQHQVEVINDCAPVIFDNECVEAVESAAQRCGLAHERIGSGAGHDACHVALKAPTGMIFVPCEDGLSHNEAESIEPEAAGRGAEVLLHAALQLAGIDHHRNEGSTHAVQVRRAEAADESDVRACVAAAYGPYVKRIGKPPAPMLDDYAALINNEVVYVATRDGRLVGLILMWPKEDHLYIDNIAVLPEEHGTGVGSVLLGFADQEAQRVGLSEIRLYTHAKMVENIQYYPRKGFRETHRATDAGYPRVYFSRFLDPPQT